MSLILPLPQAMGREEGMYAPVLPGHGPNRPQRNNNPGDLEYRGWETKFGGTQGADPRFTLFPDVRQGYRALLHCLTFPPYFGKPLSVAINTWAPAGENKPNIYLANVCLWSGLAPDTLITEELLAVPLLTNFTLGGVRYEL